VKNAVLSVITMGVVLMASACSAEVLVGNMPADEQWIRYNDFGTMPFGYDFTVGATPITVSKLGRWDGPLSATSGSIGDGLTAACRVSLYNVSINAETGARTTGTEIAAVTVQSENYSALIGEFRYESLATGVQLAANTTYRLQVQDEGGQTMYDTSMDANTMPSGSSYVTLDGAYLYQDYWATRYFVGGNAVFSPIPEPGTFALMATAVLGLLCYAWRKRK